MSNKTQLQTNNTKVASLIETLRSKTSGSSGEDVTAETEAYTTKIASLETAVTALETELQGKASGYNSPEWIDVTALPSTYADDGDEDDGATGVIRNLIIEDDTLIGLVLADGVYEPQLVATRIVQSTGNFYWKQSPINNSSDYYVNDISATAGVNFVFAVSYPLGGSCYVLPIYKPE